jgi:hypothetical protein
LLILIFGYRHCITEILRKNANLQHLVQKRIKNRVEQANIDFSAPVERHGEQSTGDCHTKSRIGIPQERFKI